ncbi:MAG TPA: SGNH/GDSL hydrolase family protein [Vicinamibacterales bacterium]|nr:SGNH/GDSL hydrolase family protein [Vicinamibacterales bacterium]
MVRSVKPERNASSIRYSIVGLAIWNLALTLLLLVPIELGARHYYPSVYQRTVPGANHPTHIAVWAEPDPDLGWTVSRSPEYAERVPHRINGQGFRDSEDFNVLPQKPLGRRHVVVLGDSFTFGVNVQETQTAPAFLGQRLGPNWRVFNLGVPGYGIDQMVLSYEKYRAALQPDVVVLVFIDEDVDRVFEAFRGAEGLAKPSFEMVNGELRERQPHKETILDSLLYRSRIANVIYSRWYRPRESVRVSGALLGRLAQETSGYSEKLVLVRYPLIEQVDGRAVYRGYPFQKVLAGYGVNYVAPLEVLRKSGDPRELYFAGDMHPTAKANRLVADAIYAAWPNEMR